MNYTILYYFLLWHIIYQKYFFRKGLKETTEFLEIQQEDNYSPEQDLFKVYKSKILQLFFIAGEYATITGLLMLFLPNYLFELNIPKMYFVGPLLVIILLLPWIGYLADIIGIRKVKITSLILSLLVLFIAPGLLPLLVNSFPAKVRCTGVVFTLQLSLCIFYSLFPVVSAYFDYKFSIKYGWIVIVYFSCFMSLMVLLWDVFSDKQKLFRLQNTI